MHNFSTLEKLASYMAAIEAEEDSPINISHKADRRARWVNNITAGSAIGGFGLGGGYGLYKGFQKSKSIAPKALKAVAGKGLLGAALGTIGLAGLGHLAGRGTSYMIQ